MLPTIGLVCGLASWTTYALVLLPLGGVAYWAIRKPDRSARRPR